MEKAIVRTIDELYKAIQVKPFTRVRRGKLEKVKGYTREGEPGGIVDVLKKHGWKQEKAKKWATELSFHHPKFPSHEITYHLLQGEWSHYQHRTKDGEWVGTDVLGKGSDATSLYDHLAKFQEKEKGERRGMVDVFREKVDTIGDTYGKERAEHELRKLMERIAEKVGANSLDKYAEVLESRGWREIASESRSLARRIRESGFVPLSTWNVEVKDLPELKKDDRHNVLAGFVVTTKKLGGPAMIEDVRRGYGWMVSEDWIRKRAGWLVERGYLNPVKVNGGRWGYEITDKAREVVRERGEGLGSL